MECSYCFSLAVYKGEDGVLYCDYHSACAEDSLSVLTVPVTQ